MLLLFDGRIAGTSGVLGGLLKPAYGDTAWRLAFAGGVVATPMVAALFGA